MPRPPGIIDRVNYVVRMVQNPCHASWYVYVETALPAALELVIALVCFDLGDVARWIFKPRKALAKAAAKAGKRRRGGHFGRKKKGSRKRNGNTLRRKIERKLPPLKKLGQRKVADGVRHLWVIDGVLQRLLFYWLLIDVVTEFFYQWTSLLYRTEFCQQALEGGAAALKDAEETISALVGWNTIGYEMLDWTDWPAEQTANGVTVTDGNWVVMAGASFFNDSAEDIEVSMRVRHSTSEGVFLFEGDLVTVPANGTADAMVTADITKGGSIVIEAFPRAGFLRVSNGIRYVQGQQNPPDLPDKFDCGLLDLLGIQ